MLLDLLSGFLGLIALNGAASYYSGSFFSAGLRGRRARGGDFLGALAATSTTGSGAGAGADTGTDICSIAGSAFVSIFAVTSAVAIAGFFSAGFRPRPPRLRRRVSLAGVCCTAGCDTASVCTG